MSRSFFISKKHANGVVEDGPSCIIECSGTTHKGRIDSRSVYQPSASFWMTRVLEQSNVGVVSIAPHIQGALMHSSFRPLPDGGRLEGREDGGVVAFVGVFIGVGIQSLEGSNRNHRRWPRRWWRRRWCCGHRQLLLREYPIRGGCFREPR